MKKLVAIIMLLALCLSVFAGCNNEKPADTDLTSAGDYLFGLYKDDKELTPSDYDVAGKIKVGSTTFDVEWTVDVTEGVTIKESSKQGFFTVDVDEKTPTEISYTLTATIKDADGNTVTKTFKRKVPAYKVFTYAEYAAAADDSAVVVKGIVTGIFSKSNGSSANGLYIQDLKEEGGYYVYGMKDDKDPSTDLGIKVGMTVEVTGTKDTYNGTYEVISASVEILDSTVKTVTPVDYTEAFTKATKLTDAALTDRQSMLVTLKGVEITGQDEKNGYYKFKLGELETYVRISSSNNCITKDEIATFKTGHSEHAAWKADVTGIVSLYSGSFYLIPATVDAFNYLSEIQKTDAEKIEIEIGNLDITNNVTEDAEITLPLKGSRYEDVTLSWALTENACATYDATTGKLTVTLPEEATKLTLTLTLSCGTATDTKTFEIRVDAKTTDLYLPSFVETIEAGKGYKLALYQATLGKYLYFTGAVTSAEYLETSDKADKAVDVFMEAVDGTAGAVRFYFMNDTAKTYIQIYKNSGGKIRLQLVTEPTMYFTYDETAKTYVTTIEDKVYYMGTYSNYNTISASETKYITGDNASKVGVSQFVAGFATLKTAAYSPEKVETLEANKGYKLALYQATLGKYLYFTGAVTSAEYLETSDKADKAVDVFMEAVDGTAGAVRFYFMNDTTKTYIQIYKNSGGKIRLQLVTEPTMYFTYDETAKTYVTTIEDKVYYMGTYSNYNTISASETKYITGDNASKVGVSQFVADFFNLAVKEVAPVAAETVEAGKGYKLTLAQNTLGQQLYFTGKVNSSEYLETSEKISKAVDVFMEAVDGTAGAVRFYFMDGTAKTYIQIYKNSGGKIRLQLVTEPTMYFTYDETAKTYVATIEDKVYYMGTYNNYNTISASETKYITGDNASKVGVSQFVAYFATIEFVK